MCLEQFCLHAAAESLRVWLSLHGEHRTVRAQLIAVMGGAEYLGALWRLDGKGDGGGTLRPGLQPRGLPIHCIGIVQKRIGRIGVGRRQTEGNPAAAPANLFQRADVRRRGPVRPQSPAGRTGRNQSHRRTISDGTRRRWRQHLREQAATGNPFRRADCDPPRCRGSSAQ